MSFIVNYSKFVFLNFLRPKVILLRLNGIRVVVVTTFLLKKHLVNPLYKQTVWTLSDTRKDNNYTNNNASKPNFFPIVMFSIYVRKGKHLGKTLNFSILNSL